MTCLLMTNGAGDLTGGASERGCHRVYWPAPDTALGDHMPGIVASEVVVPSELTAEQRQRLIDDLYLIHCQIFDGVEKASFAKYVVESKANSTSILLHKNAAGQVVGYHAVHVFEQTL